MKWNVKLKTGIFKTQEYLLWIEERKIILQDLTNIKDLLSFSYDQIKSVTFIKKNEGYELEINTNNGIYLVALTKEIDINELIGTFTSNFGKKVSLM